ncbi:MAG: exopolysaccharide biosynthesis polyprenyl glycosylphosphotransferase [Pseudomonadales bacterium]
MNQPSTRSYISMSSNFTILALFALDMLGIVLIFNINHWLVVGHLADTVLLTWKLIIVAGFTFLYFYLMDLYTFESPLSQLGMLERSFIAVVLTGITTSITVYILGPAFIGGFVGRGVLTSSLIMVWLWSLVSRYLLNHWLKQQRGRIGWLVIADKDMGSFVQDFRSQYKYEQLLVLTPPNQSIDESQATLAGTWDDLDRVLTENKITGIIVGAPDHLPEELVDRLMRIRIKGLRIYRLSDFYEQYLARLPVFHLNQTWIAMAHGFELIHNPIGLRFKRYVDILIALLAGVVLLPVLLAVTLAICFSMGRPILYRQIRTGENGTEFTVVKFRTMVTGAEDDGAQYTAADDARVTSTGRLLRKFRLDELPQLWNVLKGDMSFIGPRPERPEFIADLQRRIPYYNLRHVVKPGITGWAQVMYGYADSEEDAVEKLQYDLFYIKNYSLILDISIMVKSLKVILFGTGR